MGSKCCVAAEAPLAEVSGDAPAKTILESPPPELKVPPRKPLWLKDAEAHTARVAIEAEKAAKAQAEAEAKAVEEEARQAAQGVASPRAAQVASPTASETRQAAQGVASPRAAQVASPTASAKNDPTLSPRSVVSARSSASSAVSGKLAAKGTAAADPTRKPAEEEDKRKKARPSPKAKEGDEAPGVQPALVVKAAPAPQEKSLAAAQSIDAPPAAGGAGRSPPRSKDLRDMVYTLKVKIIGARNLRNADDFGESDPFCVCMIKGKPKSKFQTKVVNENANPRWDHSVQMSGFAMNDTLVFEVWDKDTFSANDLLGRAEMKRDQFTPSAFKGNLKLRDTNAKSAVSQASTLQLEVDILKVHAEPSAANMIEVRRYDSGTWKKRENCRNVMITFVSARGLRNADWGLSGLSDPYCVCEIPGKERSRIKTPVINDNLDPVWNFKSRLEDYEDGDSLSFAVLDKDVGKKDDVLGRAALAQDQLARGFKGELELKDAGKGVKAYLKVVVEVDGKASAAPATAASEKAGGSGVAKRR